MPGVELRQLLGCQVVVGAPVDHARQPGIREHADRQRRVLAEVAQVLLHLGRSGGAVDAEHVGSHRAHRDDCRADLRADQHPAGRLHRHLDLQRHLAPRRLHRPAAGDHRRFDLEQVHARLDDEQIDATLEQPAGLDLVGVAEIGEVDVAEARKLCARSDRAPDVSGPAVGGVAVGNLARRSVRRRRSGRGRDRRRRTRRGRGRSCRSWRSRRRRRRRRRTPRAWRR